MYLLSIFYIDIFYILRNVQTELWNVSFQICLKTDHVHDVWISFRHAHCCLSTLPIIKINTSCIVPRQIHFQRSKQYKIKGQDLPNMRLRFQQSFQLCKLLSTPIPHIFSVTLSVLAYY